VVPSDGIYNKHNSQRFALTITQRHAAVTALRFLGSLISFTLLLQQQPKQLLA